MTSYSGTMTDDGSVEAFDVLERRLRQDLERLYDEKISLKKQRLDAIRRLDLQLKVVEERQETISRELERIRIEAIEERYRKELEQLKEKDVEIGRLREDLARVERTSADVERKKREALQECNRLTIQLVRLEKAKAAEARELTEKLRCAADEISELKAAEWNSSERIRDLEASLALARTEAEKSAELERQLETVHRKFELFRTVTWLTQKRALDESRRTYSSGGRGRSVAIYEEVADLVSSPCLNIRGDRDSKSEDENPTTNYVNIVTSTGSLPGSSAPEGDDSASDGGLTLNELDANVDQRDSFDEDDWNEDYVNLSQQLNSLDSYRKSQLLMEAEGDFLDDCKPHSSDAHVCLLRELYDALTQKICSQSVAVRMFQCNALTLGELESIQSDRCRPTEATKMLLNFLLKQPVEVFDCFLEALKESKQTDVYEWLVSDGQTACPPDVTHANLIQEQYGFLLESMDAMHSGIVERLWSDGVLDHSEREDITAEQSSTRRNEKLLSVLSRKSAVHFQTFLEALDKTGQQHIMDQLFQSTCNPVQRRSWTAMSSSSCSDLSRKQLVSRKRSVSLTETRFPSINQHPEPGDSSPADYVYTYQHRMSVTSSCSLTDANNSNSNNTLAPDHLYEQLNELEKALRESVARELQLRLAGCTDRENRLQLQLDTVRDLAPLAFEHAFLEPRVIHAFPAASPVLGIALLQDELFVLRQRDGEQIEVYDAVSSTTKPYVLKRRVAVKGLNCGSSWNDMASCNRNFYVYVSDYTTGSVHCVERLGKSSQWQVRDKPCGVSVTPIDCNVLVTCRETARLRLFTPRGKQLREICLQPDIISPWHAVQLSLSPAPGHHYVLCHGWKDALHRVCIVDTGGRVVYAYSAARPDPGDPGSDVLDGPRHLAVDHDGFVFVADSSTCGGVLLLSPTLQRVRKIASREHALRFPCRLCLDVDRRRLCAGQFSHGKLTAFQL